MDFSVGKYNISLSKWDLIIAAGMIIYAIVFSIITLYCLSGYLFNIDLAIFNQAFWTTINTGGLLENSIEGKSHFGFHFSPILFLLLPIYYLLPGAGTLLIIQSFLLALGALPIYLCGKELLGEKPGLIIALTYLLYPALHGVTLFEFHEVAFLPFLLGMALWCMITDRKNYCLLFCLSLLCIKEDVTLLVFMIGLIGLIKHRNEGLTTNWQYIIMIVLPPIVFAIFLLLIKPIFWVGAPLSQLTQFTDPMTSLANGNEERLIYLGKLFLPLLLLPFAAPEILIISIPSFLEILTTANTNYFSIQFHYSAAVIPVLFFATIITFKKIKEHEKIQKMFYPLLVALIIVTITSACLFSPALLHISLIQADYQDKISDNSLYLEKIAHVIPKDASVSTQRNLLPLMSERDKIFEDYREDVDVILIDSKYHQSKMFDDNIAEIAQKYYALSFTKENIYLFIKNDRTDLINLIKQNLQIAN